MDNRQVIYKSPAKAYDCRDNNYRVNNYILLYIIYIIYKREYFKLNNLFLSEIV